MGSLLAHEGVEVVINAEMVSKIIPKMFGMMQGDMVNWRTMSKRVNGEMCSIECKLMIMCINKIK